MRGAAAPEDEPPSSKGPTQLAPLLETLLARLQSEVRSATTAQHEAERRLQELQAQVGREGRLQGMGVWDKQLAD